MTGKLVIKSILIRNIVFLANFIFFLKGFSMKCQLIIAIIKQIAIKKNNSPVDGGVIYLYLVKANKG